MTSQQVTLVQFTPEVKEAWATAYGVLATTMKNAAA